MHLKVEQMRDPWGKFFAKREALWECEVWLVTLGLSEINTKMVIQLQGGGWGVSVNPRSFSIGPLVSIG